MLFDRYEKYQKYINGVPASPPEYKKGDYLGQYEFDSLEDCENIAIYRWVETGETICVDYSLYREEKKQVSTDGGVTWKDTDDRRGGTLIEEHSEECGWHLVCEWHSIGTICSGYNLIEQFRLEISYDMGATWEPTEHYRQEIKEYLNKDCALQSDPLTYELHLEGEEIQSVTFDLPHKIGDNKEYYVIWGDTLDYIDTVTDDGSNPSHLYAGPGDFTVKFWLLADTIGDAEFDNGTYGISNWGTSNLMYYGGDYDLGSNESYFDPKANPYFKFGIPSTVQLSTVSTIVNDNNESFKYLLKFYCNSPNLTVIPPNLFKSANKLYRSTFSNTLINSIPDGLFNNTSQRDFSYTFSGCKNLTSVNSTLFNGVKTFVDGPKDYFDSNPATVRCKDCIANGDVVGAVKECENVVVSTFKYYPEYPTSVTRHYFSPTASEVETLIEFYKTEAKSPSMTFSDDVVWDWISTYAGDFSINDDCAPSESYYPKIWSSYKENSCGEWIFTNSIEKLINEDGGVWEKAGTTIIYNNDYTTNRTWDNGLNLTETFSDCTSLTTVGNIIAPNSKIYSCQGMFRGCNNLTNPINILENTLLGAGYYKMSNIVDKDPLEYSIDVNLMSMFNGCSKIDQPIVLPNNFTPYSEYIRPYCISGSHNWTQINRIGKKVYLSYMYEGTSITDLTLNSIDDIYTYDVSDIANNVKTLTSIKTNGDVHITEGYSMADGCENLLNVDPIKIDNAEYAFRNCYSLVDISNIQLFKDASYTFSGCKSITNIPAGIFPNRQLDLNLTYTFNSCIGVTTIDDNIIDEKVQLLEDETDNINLSYTFNNCYSLTNYPKINNIPIWMFERFYDPNHPSTYLKTYAFNNCNIIDPEVPLEWGGYLNFNGSFLEVEITTTTENESLGSLEGLYVNAVYSIGINNNYIINEPGVYNAIILTTSDTYTFPDQVTKILNVDKLYDIFNYKNCTYICSGVNLWKTRTNLNEIFKDCTVLTDVADDIFKNCTNVNQMNYPFENCALSEDKVTTIMRYITTLTNADYILRNKDFTTTCGIVDNNPNLISMNYAFDNMPNLTTLPSNFPTSLTQMDGAFRYCTSLTGEAPNLWTRSGLSGIWAFGGCSKLTNYSSIDQKWGGNPHLYCKATGTDECEISMSYGELVTDLGINAGVYYWMKNDAIPALKNYGAVPSREVNIYKIGDTNIQNFEYGSEAENVEIYG